MELLVLGGTAFLGHELARVAVARGHAVTCVARGSGVPHGATLVPADRDEEDGLAPLTTQRWDAVVDVARQPGHVRRAVRDLDTVHYVLISSCSVYADTRTLGQDEEAPLLPALASDVLDSPQDYGRAKVACEQHLRHVPHTIARAGLIGGPSDPSGRSGYWPWRFARDRRGTVLVPAADDLPVRLVDVRDLADWVVRCAETRLQGVFNATGSLGQLGGTLAEARSLAKHTGQVVRASGEWLTAADVRPWMGPRSLPLWLDDPGWRGILDHDNARAVAAGLRFRPVSETLRDAGATYAGGAGLTDSEQQDLLSRLGAPG